MEEVTSIPSSRHLEEELTPEQVDRYFQIIGQNPTKYQKKITIAGLEKRFVSCIKNLQALSAMLHRLKTDYKLEKRRLPRRIVLNQMKEVIDVKRVERKRFEGLMELVKELGLWNGSYTIKIKGLKP